MWQLKYAMLLLALALMVLIPDARSQEKLLQIKGYSYQVRNWPPDNNTPATVSTIAQTPDGYLWLANAFGLYRFDGIRCSFLNGSSSAPFKYQDCGALYLTSDSSLLAGFSKGLLLKYKNRNWTILDSEKVFMDKNITAISEDKSHNLWVGLAGNGVLRYSR